VLASGVIHWLQPNFKRLTEQQSELEGNYRTAHSRLIANSEEISFLGGANLERKLMTNIFDQLFEHCRLFASKRAWIGCIDQYLIKYGSSVTG
jgi:ATP-binding cassette subfamily D (ALD) long-chain fatty acid import protein